MISCWKTKKILSSGVLVWRRNYRSYQRFFPVNFFVYSLDIRSQPLSLTLVFPQQSRNYLPFVKLTLLFTWGHYPKKPLHIKCLSLRYFVFIFILWSETTVHLYRVFSYTQIVFEFEYCKVNRATWITKKSLWWRRWKSPQELFSIDKNYTGFFCLFFCESPVFFFIVKMLRSLWRGPR